MKINFEFTADDWISWQEQFDQTSKSSRSVIRRRRLIICSFLLFGIPLMGFRFFPDLWQIFVVVGVVMSVGYFIGYPKTFARQRREGIKIMRKHGELDGLIGWRELEITPAGLMGRSENGELLSYWHGIKRVEESDTHHFVCLNALSAHVIPKARLLKEDLDAFMSELKRRMADAKPL